jgi:DNA (cytosine-5)-methyltransferase 1
MRLKVFTAFSGYDSLCLALRRLGIDYELVGWSEIDKYAIQAHNALFSEAADRNYGDICKIDWAQVPDFDLFTYSFPCTDISAAGQQKGLEKGSGTRSSLLWECEKAIEIKRPKFLLLENVKALVQKKFEGSFNEWQTILEGYGYANFAKVLNAKDYGVPQNRERIFLVSIRMDGLEGLVGNVQYYFPQPMPLDKRLKDVLEAEVDEKYYLSEKMMEYFNRVNADTSHCHKFKPKDGEDTAFTIRTAPGQRVDDNFVLGWTRDSKGKVVNRHPVEVANCVTAAKRDNTQNYVLCLGRNGAVNTDNEGNCRTIKAQYCKNSLANFARRDGLGATGVVNNLRIRKLTPRECFRLMGVDDADIDKIQAAGISNSQQYKMAGNSIVVDVLYHIFRKLLVEPGQEGNQQTLF